MAGPRGPISGVTLEQRDRARETTPHEIRSVGSAVDRRKGGRGGERRERKHEEASGMVCGRMQLLEMFGAGRQRRGEHRALEMESRAP